MDRAQALAPVQIEDTRAKGSALFLLVKINLLSLSTLTYNLYVVYIYICMINMYLQLFCSVLYNCFVYIHC